MKKFLIAALLSAVFIPAYARAELNYNSIDVGYATTSYSDGSPNLTELNIAYSDSLSDRVFYRAALAKSSQLNLTNQGYRRVLSITAGGGYHMPLKKDIDGVVQGNLTLGSASPSGGSSASGYDLGAGVRAQFMKALEGSLLVVHASISNGIRATADTFLSARFGYNFIPELQMYAGLDLKSDITTHMGLRFFF